jgi:O-antigen/teichoic acid export membrane protein
MRQSARILLNTALMFGRMFFTFGVGLYATRILINLLGHSDYGVLAALGATGALTMFIGRGLNVSAQRYLAYEIGRSDDDRLSEVFTSTLVLFSGMSVGVLLFGVAIEPLVIEAVQIPPEREAAASTVFYFTLVNLVTIMAVTPFRSVVNARQAMGQVALFETVRSLLRLVSVVLLFVVEGDSLVLYAGFLMVFAIARSLAMAAVCVYRFPESRPRPSKFRLTELGRVARFGGWSTLLTGSYLAFKQATVVLLSVAFSPVITAGYAIAMAVGDYHTNFARVLPRVVQPAMTTLEARGERSNVQALAVLTGKYATLGVLLFVVPLMLETEGILRLWLGTYPVETPFFVRMTMLWLTIQVSSSGFERAVYAHGDLRIYAIRAAALWLLALAAGSFCLFGLRLGPWSVPATIVAATLVQIPLRVGYAGRLIGLGYAAWAREIVGRVLPPALVGLLAGWLVHERVDDGWARYVLVVGAYALASLPVTWWLAVGAREKLALGQLAESGRATLRARLGR